VNVLKFPLSSSYDFVVEKEKKEKEGKVKQSPAVPSAVTREAL